VVHNLEHVLDGLYDHHAKTRVSRSHHLKSPLEIQFNNRGKFLITKNAMNEWNTVPNLMTYPGYSLEHNFMLQRVSELQCGILKERKCRIIFYSLDAWITSILPELETVQ